MKKFIVELDDQCARDLERVAPSRLRLRAEFVRRAIRREIDRALDRVTEEGYRAHPMPAESGSADMLGWDPQNELAKKARKKAKARPRRRAHSKAA
jgi:predicted transcriptional regulator